MTGRWATVLADYRDLLDASDLSQHARRAYGSRVAGFLDWLATGPALAVDEDPLTTPHARDAAVRNYRRQLKTDRRATPWTINAHLTALDHFFAHHLGLGAPVIQRERIAPTAPEALDDVEQRRFIRSCGQCGSARNAAIGLLLLYSGLRVEEIEALDVDDIVISSRRAKVIVRGGAGVHRAVPLHPAPRRALSAWLDQRLSHRGADQTPALFLNRLGGRLLVRSIRTVVAELGTAAGLVHDAGPDTGKSRVHPHTLRHTFNAQLSRNGVDIVTVADLMGRATVNATRSHTRSSETDRTRAIDTALITEE